MEKLTGSVRKETIAVSGTIRINLQNQRHSQLLLQNLRFSRMDKFQREQKVLEAEVRLGECLVCRARNIAMVPGCPFYETKEGCKLGGKVFLCTPPG